MPIKITREEFHKIYIQGEEATFKFFEMLVERINALEIKVAELEARISKDSRNSSKPPASDFIRKTPKSLRETSGKKSGGQPGHQGHSLKQTATPDRIIHCHCSGTCPCGRDLSQAKVISQEKCQVMDLPEPKLETTEYRADTVRCACGALHTAEFPAGVDAPA